MKKLPVFDCVGPNGEQTLRQILVEYYWESGMPSAQAHICADDYMENWLRLNWDQGQAPGYRR